jgi:hypothetical protein
MKKETLINLGLVLLILSTIFLLVASNRFAGILETLISIASLALLIGLSIYKVALWFRYRHDHEKRERVVYSFRSLPKELRRWYQGESKSEEKQR